MRQISGRSIVNGLVFIALLAQFLWLVGHVLFGWGEKTYPATPPQLVFNAPVPPSGGDVLLRLSAVAASEGSPAWATATPYAYVKVRTWHLRAHGPQGVLHARPVAAWRTRTEVPALADSTPALQALLSSGQRDNGTAPGWEFAALAHLGDLEPVPADIESRLLRLLARLPGLVNDGTTTDRAGRAGAAVSLESGYTGEPITYTLIFDPASGALLESDETLAGTGNRINALKGSVVAYTTFLGSGYVATRTATPSPG